MCPSEKLISGKAFKSGGMARKVQMNFGGFYMPNYIVEKDLHEGEAEKNISRNDSTIQNPIKRNFAYYHGSTFNDTSIFLFSLLLF